MEEKKIVKKFMSEVHSGRGLGVYGILDVIKSLQNGIVDMVIVTDDITFLMLYVKCKRCGTIQEKFIDRSNLLSVKQELLSRPGPSCSAVDYESGEKDIVDYLEELAAMTASRLEIISGKSEEGAQMNSLGRIGAILRFKPSSGSIIARIS